MWTWVLEKSGEEIREFHKGETHLNRQRDLAGSRESMWATSSGGRFPQMELSSVERSRSDITVFFIFPDFRCLLFRVLGIFFLHVKCFCKRENEREFWVHRKWFGGVRIMALSWVELSCAILRSPKERRAWLWSLDPYPADEAFLLGVHTSLPSLPFLRVWDMCLGLSGRVGLNF